MNIHCQGLDFTIELGRPDSEGWMSAAVTIRVPSMSSKFTCTIESAEWEGLADTLKRLEENIGSNCSGTWANMEENIEFTFALTERGALSGTYKFSPNNFSLGPVLSGAFEADQTFIRLWATAAAECVA